MTNIAMVYRWPKKKIDGLPTKKWWIFSWRTVK